MAKKRKKNWMDVSVREGISRLKKSINKVAQKIVEKTK